MATGRVETTVTVAGLNISSRTDRTGEGQIAQDPTLPAATSGACTRSDSNTGVVTAAGHGLTTGDKVNVFWSGGCRFGMDATVAGDDVTVDGGAGDDLPVGAATPCYIAEQVVVDMDVVGNNIQLLTISANYRVHVDFQSGAGASLLSLDLPASEQWTWLSGQDITNPLAGQTVASVKVSAGFNHETVLQIGCLYDSVA